MATNDLAFQGPMGQRDFLQRSDPDTETPTPAGPRTQGKLRLTSLALAGGMFVATLTGPVAASTTLSVLKKESAHRSSVQVQRDGSPGAHELAGEWDMYLDSLRGKAGIDAQMAKAIRAFWTRLEEDFHHQPPVPVAGPTEQHTFILVWDQGRHHVEVEFLDGDTVEWFYRDRQTESIEAGDGTLELAVHATRGYLDRAASLS